MKKLGVTFVIILNFHSSILSQTLFYNYNSYIEILKSVKNNRSNLKIYTDNISIVEDYDQTFGHNTIYKFSGLKFHRTLPWWATNNQPWIDTFYNQPYENLSKDSQIDFDKKYRLIKYFKEIGNSLDLALATEIISCKYYNCKLIFDQVTYSYDEHTINFYNPKEYKTDSEIFAEIEKNWLHTYPYEVLKKYPNHREFIKRTYRRMCTEGRNCEGYVDAFPETINDPEIRSRLERQNASSMALLNYANKVVEGVKEMPKKMLSERVESSSNSLDNERKEETTDSDTESDFDKCEKMDIPSVKKRGDFEERKGIVDGIYYAIPIEFTDGVEGTLFLGKETNRYFISDGPRNFYYKSDYLAINALYRYKSCGFISKIGRW